MINSKIKLQILERILRSERFKSSKRYSDLLEYLVNANIDGKKVKETTIAIELFHKDKSFNPSEDTIVRVSIGNLRKRIEHFYLTDGSSDSIRLELTKGTYDIIFKSVEKKQQLVSQIRKKIKFIAPIIISAIMLGAIIYLWNENYNLNKKIDHKISIANPIWNEFLQDKKPILVILGDYFFMTYSRTDNKPRFNVRDPLINSIDDFNEYFKLNPNEKGNLIPLEHTYLRPSAIWGFMQLLPILNSTESSFIVKQSSEIDWDDINSYNIIFIGTFKQLYNLNQLLFNIDVDYSIYPNSITIKKSADQENKVFESNLNRETRKYQDICLLSKFSGPNNNTILIISGFEDGGVILGAKSISDPSFFDKIIEKYKVEISSPIFFRCVINVEGFRHTDLKSELLYFDLLEEVNFNQKSN